MEDAGTARTRCGGVKFRECSELVYGRIFPPKLKGAVNKSFVRTTALNVSEAWCLKEIWEFCGQKDPW